MEPPTVHVKEMGLQLVECRFERTKDSMNLFGTFLLTFLCHFDTWRAFKLPGRVMRRRLSAFEIYLRTGRRVPDQPELVEIKFNPWHDPEDGR